MVIVKSLLKLFFQNETQVSLSNYIRKKKYLVTISEVESDDLSKSQTMQ